MQQSLEALAESRTTFVIAHRLSTIKNADKILVMRHGDIIERELFNALAASLDETGTTAASNVRTPACDILDVALPRLGLRPAGAR